MLPEGYSLRSATAADIGAIRRLVLSAFLDPTQLRWQQFWVVEQSGAVMACGQLRQFEGAQELGSVVVEKALRGQGIGSAVIEHLIAQATQPLYLECVGKGRSQFYTRFGFEGVDWKDLPPSLKGKFGVGAIAHQFLRLPIFCMQRLG